ncbi:MAG: FlgD immunoglobulin-like domain containing protein [Candidatus Eisenbacteria bacterium]
MRTVRVLLCAALLLLAATVAHAQTISITSNVTTNTTWGPTGTVVGTTFWVKNNISITAGATLTVQPGVVVKFNPGCQLAVSGALQAVGTAGSNIYFTSIKDDNNPAGDTNGDGNTTSPATGDWNSIVFADATVDGTSALTWCDIRYAGSSQYAALTFLSCSHPITNCFVRKGYYGIDCQGLSSPTVTTTSIEASSLTPIVLDFTASPTFSSLVFSTANNGYDAIGLRGTTLTSTAVLPKRGATVGANPVSNVTYVLLGGLTINAGGNLTINPGVVIKPVGGYSIQVNSGGNLTMVGTAAAGDTITITSIHDDNFGGPNDTNNNGSITAPNRGDWGQIAFAQGATGSIGRCRLKFGTNAGTVGMVQMTNNNIAISNSLLSDAGHALALFGTSSPLVSNVAMNNCSSTPILQSVAATPTYTSLSFLANAITAIGLHGEDVTVNSTLSQQNVAGYTNITYYLMNGPLHVPSGVTLTIAPGIVLKNQPFSGGINVDGALIADGTPVAPIVFTSLYDDQYGSPQDTNGDGATTTPGSGNWQYIHFFGTSNDATCVLDNCRVTYGGYYTGDSWPPLVWATSASPRITNSTFFKGPYGIRTDGDSAPVVDGDTFDNLTYAPIAMSVLSDPQISTSNTYTTNGYNALALLSETLSQNARLKYRPNVGNAASPTFCYLPTGQITVASGVTLSVDPQVVLKPTGAFTVFNVNGALNLVGTNATTGRVFFTSRRDDALGGDTTPTDSSTPQAGDWGDIEFNDTAVDAACIVRNVLFQFGGFGNANGVLTTNSAAPRFARLEFFQIRTAFTFTGNSTPTLDSLNILNCLQLPIVSSLVSSPTYGNTITFANSQYLALGILGETVAQDVRTRVGKIGPYTNLNYAPTGTITIAFGAKWTIDPGVVLKFGRLFTDPIGTYIQVDGAISAVGKPDSLIIFTAMPDDAFGQDVMGDGAATAPAPGQWYGLQFNAASNDAANQFTHCRFRYGSNGTGVVYLVSAAPTFTNCIFTRNYNAPAYVSGASTPSFVNCDFDSTTSPSNGLPVFLSLVSDPTFTNCRFLGNWYTALGVIGESIAQDVLWKIRSVAGRLNMPYYLNSQLTVGLGATLSMQPGVRVKCYNGSILVQRAFQAEGRTQPDSMIVFTSYRDDAYGGDSNGDGGNSSPGYSDWSYIQIDGTAIDAQCRFRNVLFRFGGSGSTQGAIRAVNSSPSVDSCLFAYNTVGVSVEGSSNPTIHGSSFLGSQYYAVNNTGNAFCVAADGNWWGAATGPNDASATADLCGMTTNAGSGDIVSNNVDYTPFATSGILNPLLGDVSLNGLVLAYDASLVLQHVVNSLALSPLQKLVADVSGSSGVTAFDGSLILQWVAGVIPAFPAVSNSAHEAPDGALAARAFVERTRGTFALSLGEARRSGDEWLVPVTMSGDAPVYALELRLEGGDAASLSGFTAAAGAPLSAHHADSEAAWAAMASLDPVANGEVATLRFPATDAAFRAPTLAFGRVNESEVTNAPAPQSPRVSLLGLPAPNPTKGPASLQLTLSAADGAANARVDVVDVAGRHVRALSRAPLGAGAHTLTWDLTRDDGSAAGAGLYFIRARVGSASFTRRLIVVR